MMWTENDDRLCADLTFVSFREAFAFMTEVAIEADKADHHPSWHNVYNRVRIELSTHEAGNVVTDKDRALALIIEQIFRKYRPA